MLNQKYILIKYIVILNYGIFLNYNVIEEPYVQ